MTPSEEEIRYEMERSLLEWGVDTTRGKRHLEFHRKSMQQVLQCSRGENIELCEHTCADVDSDHSSQQQYQYSFPSDIEDLRGLARHIITTEFINPESRNRRRSHATHSDALMGRASTVMPPPFSPPFRVKYDRHWKVATKSSHYKIQYELKEEFIRFTRQDLDPFYRFFLEEVPMVPTEEYYFNRLTREDYLRDVLFKVIVGCHVVKNESCRSCAAGNGCLHWSANRCFIGSNWNHIECRQCRSTYTMQSREWIVRSNEESKRIEGGSYAHYHQMKFAETQDSATTDERKHYIVLSRRDLTLDPDEKRQEIPVQIAEIDGILPRLTHDSFLFSNEPNIPILSWIRFVPKSRNPWFHFATEGFKIRDTAKEVYNEQFPGQWDQLSNMMTRRYPREELENAHLDVKEMPDSSQERASAPEKQVIDNLKSELKMLKDGIDSDADWEECYASD